MSRAVLIRAIKPSKRSEYSWENSMHLWLLSKPFKYTVGGLVKNTQYILTAMSPDGSGLGVFPADSNGAVVDQVKLPGSLEDLSDKDHLHAVSRFLSEWKAGK